jgi:hypothetical protein
MLDAKAERLKEDPMIRVAISAFMLMLFATPDAAQFTDWSPPVNLGSVVNSGYADTCVSVSKNGLSLFFFSNRYALDANAAGHLYVSKRASVDEPWGEPEEIVGFNDYMGASCPALSPDEHRLFFVSSRSDGCGGNDIWVSRRQNRRDDFGWESPVNLGCIVNSTVGDIVPTVIEDETGTEVLYFTSGRPGGSGGGDIWESRMGDDDTFGAPSLVTELNTTYSDVIAVRRDGLEAIVASNRPGGLYSGTDLWTVTRESTGEPWSTPVILPVLCSPGFEGARMSFSFDGRVLYFPSDRAGGYGSRDLYMTEREKIRR